MYFSGLHTEPSSGIYSTFWMPLFRELLSLLIFCLSSLKGFLDRNKEILEWRQKKKKLHYSISKIKPRVPENFRVPELAQLVLYNGRLESLVCWIGLIFLFSAQYFPDYGHSLSENYISSQIPETNTINWSFLYSVFKLKLK